MATGTIVSLAFPIVQSQFGYLLSYQDNLEKLETEVRRLEGIKESVQHSADEAERNGEKIKAIVQDWLMKEANDTVVKAKRLIDEAERHAEAGCCMGLFTNLWTRSQLSKRFEEMTHKISEVIEKGKFDRLSDPVRADVTCPPSARGYETLESRTSMLNEIKEALKDPEIYMIGVHGMGGVGKTSLAKELAWQVKKDGSFGAVVIATITHSPDVKKIQCEIAGGLMDRKLEKESEGERAAELRQRIRQEKSILIILDDIWSNELTLTEVGIPFGDGYEGCKLVVTSRDLNVLKYMGTQKEFNLRTLREEDSWNLFQKVAGDVVNDFGIKQIAQKVAKCCVGLPLLIVTVAKGLRKKDVIAWKDALRQLERLDHEELQKKVYITLEWSYNSLENDELKKLFLVIGSSGVNNIHTGELFSCCWGLMDSYRDMRTLTEARDRHCKLINDLRASSLLLEADTEPEWVKMHDVVCDFAKQFASRFHPIYAVQRYTKMKEWPKVDELQKFNYIIIPWSYIDELPEKLECPKLKLLLLHNIGGHRLKVPDNFFSGMREVSTLNLYGMAFTPSLPPSLGLLISLCSLILNTCNLGDIKIVSKLENLEILSLEKSTMEELPKEIGHLTRLRLLNLSQCSKLRVIPTNLLSSLMCLEELYMGGCCYIEWEVEGSKSESKNTSLGELQNLHQLTTLEISIPDTSVLPRDLQFLAKLERYSIFIGYMWEWPLEWAGGAHETSRTLKLTDSCHTSISLKTVEDLSFDELKGVKHVLYELDVEGFPQLKHLRIQDSDELLHIISSRGLVNPHYAFPNLETLILHTLHNMEQICHGPLPTRSFAKLKVIKVESCDKLKNLLLYSVVRNLSQLHEMEISKCKGMKEIIAMEEQEDEKELPQIVLPELHSLTLQYLPILQSFSLPLIVDKANPSIQSIPLALFNQQVVMPKLETLELRGIDTFKIWDDKLPASSCIQNLKSLKISHFDSLTSLFSSWVARALVKLQQLEISSCFMVNQIFVQGEVEFPNLETLHISYMHDLKSIWPNQLALNSFCKLNKITIENCKSLDYVFPISVAKMLRQLQVLEISHCSIKNIVEKSDSCDMTLVYLEKLSVSNCPNMETIVPSSVLFQTLDELKVYKCAGLVNIIMPSTITSLPILRILSIKGCGKLEEIYGSMNEGDAALGEIAFMKLEELRLRHLTRLTSFCEGSYDFKFRSLQTVHLHKCPMMETFCHGNLTAPSYTKVQCGQEEEDHWDGDLNTTIRTIFIEKNFEQDMSSSSDSELEGCIRST